MKSFSHRAFWRHLAHTSDPTSEALLIDSAIDQLIGPQLEFESGAVELNDRSIFPADTLFEAVDDGVQYASGVDAIVGSVPEPASLPMLAFGLVALAALRFR